MEFENIIIEPKSIEKNYWRDIWKYRDLIYILTWRDIKVRYKQTMLGVIWALIKPAITLGVFVIVFGKIAGLDSKSVTPYPLIVIAGLIPWQFFSTAFLSASESLISNSNLLTKVYFPRLIIPISAVLTSIVDYLISYSILIAILFYYQKTLLFNINIFYLLFFSILIFCLSFGIGLFFATLNVKYRDFRYIIPFFVQFGIYITPVGFSTEFIPPNLNDLIYLNPLTSIIDGFRFSLFANSDINPFNSHLLYSVVFSIVLMIYSIYNFRKFEKTFADII
jgi:lipopolysaccharide transport system permease protein